MMRVVRKYILAMAAFAMCLVVSVNAWAWPGVVG